MNPAVLALTSALEDLIPTTLRSRPGASGRLRTRREGVAPVAAAFDTIRVGHVAALRWTRDGRGQRDRRFGRAFDDAATCRLSLPNRCELDRRHERTMIALSRIDDVDL